jgi:hypothetical protein
MDHECPICSGTIEDFEVSRTETSESGVTITLLCTACGAEMQAHYNLENMVETERSRTG